MQYFHVKDCSTKIPCGILGHDKLYLVRPVLDAMLEKYVSSYNTHKNSSVDETMVAFHCHLGLRQILPSKPSKYGMKVWVLADPINGYTSDYQVYTGREEAGITEVGFSTHVVLDLTQKLANCSHVIKTDSYFTCPDLLQCLLRQGLYARGTVWSKERTTEEILSQQLRVRC